MKYLLLSISIIFNLLFGQTDILWTEVSGDTVTIHHDNTERNCGALFNFNVAFLDSSIIVITEVDTGTTALCDCEFDLELMIGGLSTGIWTAEIFSQDFGNNGESEYYGSVEFTITEQEGGVVVLNSYQSQCNFSTSYLDYFPVHIGDKWQYFTTGFEMYETHTYYYTITVTGETIMPNNERYFTTDFWPLGYIRVDTTEQTVYAYNDFPVGSNCTESEIDRFKLFLADNGMGATTACGNINVDYYTNTIFEDIVGDSLQTIRYSWYDGTDFSFRLEPRLGIQSWSMSLGIYGSYGYLIAAEINGVTYGEFVDEDSSLYHFFPLHIGDKWQYEVYDVPYDTVSSYITFEILGDTVLPNGFKYYETNFWEMNFIRIDTNEHIVYKYEDYNFNDTCQNDETDLFKLFLVDSTSGYTENCHGLPVEYSSGRFYSGLLEDSTGYIYYDWSDLLGYRYQLTENLGITSWVIFEGTGASGYLVAAEINGVIYGEFVGIDNKNPIPQNFKLYPAYPNPFNPVTTIRFSVNIHGRVSLQIFDITGSLVETLINEPLTLGDHEITWNAGNLPSGVYFVRLQSGEFVENHKILLIK